MIEEVFKFFTEHYYIPFYFIVLIVAITTYRKYFDTPLKYFPVVIAYTFFNEFLGYFIRYTDGFSFFSKEELLYANDLIYNIYDIVFYGFFFFTFWKLAKLKKDKKLISIASLVGLLSYIVSLFFQNPIEVLLFYASAITSWMLLLCILNYCFKIRIMGDWKWQKHNMMLWISFGLGIFYFFFPILILIGFLNFELWQKLHLRTILRILIIVMHSLFIIGFLISKRRAFR